MDNDGKSPVVSAGFLYIALAARMCVLLGMIALTDARLFHMPSPVIAEATHAKAVLVLLFLFWVELCALMVWTARVNGCLVDRLRFGLATPPIMAGLGYIIPVVGLWKPYFAVREIYKASRSPETWLSDGRSAIVSWWWAAYMASLVIGLAAALATHQIALMLPVVGIVLRVLLLIKLVLLFIIVMRVMGWLKQRGAMTRQHEVF